MSATTERRESTGIVAETLRRPIENAVREGVREALEEQTTAVRERPGGASDDASGSGGRKFALLVLLGIGVAAFLLWRRRGGGPSTGDEEGMTESIRSRSKTGQSGSSDSMGSMTGSGDEGVEMTEGSVKTEDTVPEAGNE